MKEVYRFNEAKGALEVFDERSEVWKFSRSATPAEAKNFLESKRGRRLTVVEATQLQSGRSFTMPSFDEQVRDAQRAFAMSESVARLFVKARSTNKVAGYDAAVEELAESLRKDVIR